MRRSMVSWRDPLRSPNRESFYRYMHDRGPDPFGEPGLAGRIALLGLPDDPQVQRVGILSIRLPDKRWKGVEVSVFLPIVAIFLRKAKPGILSTVDMDTCILEFTQRSPGLGGGRTEESVKST